MFGLGENIEIDSNTVEKGEIKGETTKPVVETIQPVAENRFFVTVEPDLTIKEGRNRHPPIRLVYYDSYEGFSQVDEENMELLIILDLVNFEEVVKSPKLKLAMGEEIKFIKKTKN